MSSAFTFLIPLALLGVVVVLVLGLLNMLRTGSGNTSQKLMRWRVVLQFLAIILVMAAVYFTRG